MKNQKEQDVALIAGEFAACDIGDKRRTMRLQAIATSLAREPGASLPKALPAVKEREGAYRLLENPAVDFQSIMQGHFAATRERVSSSSGRLLVLHDTTKAQFSTEREGLGQLRGKGTKHGFYLHASLATSLGVHRDPLGLVATQAWTRTPQVKAMRKQAGVKEMDRWLRGVRLAGKQLPQDAEPIHVMDREGDSFELFSQLIAEDHSFCIRACHDRVCDGG